MLTSIDTKQLLLKIADLYVEKEEELSQYDGIIGDGDHGITMARGAKVAKQKVSDLIDGLPSDYLKAYGRTLISAMGGAMGPLFGSIFLELAKACKGKETLSLENFATGFKNAELKIIELGGAKVGDKTMLDSIDPVVIALAEATEKGMSLKEGFQLATIAGEQGVENTIPMKAKRGRARYLEDKSIGHQDAGATSFYYLIKEIRDYINKTSN
jgi:dihydroxyacetone kinase-like protein